MRTLFIASHLSIGGAESISLKQANILSPDVKFICTDNFGYIANRLIENRYDVLDMSHIKDKQAAISNEINEYNPDLIILSNAVCYKALSSTKHLRHKTITQIHGDISSPANFSSRFIDWHVDFLDGVICSHVKTSDVLKSRYKNIKQTVIPNPIDKQFFNTNRNSQSYTIGFCGRISPEKRLVSIAKILALTKNYIPEINAMIIGDADPSYSKCTDYKKKTIAAFAEYEIPLNITGFLYPCVADLARIKLGLLLSELEGFANFPFEAYAIGIPMISTNVGAMYTIMDSSDIISVEEPGELSQEIANKFSAAIVQKFEEESSLDLKSKVAHAHEDNYKLQFLNFLLGL